MKYLYFLTILLLLLALLNMPMPYYTLLRTIVSISAVSIIFKEAKTNFNFWAILFIFIALLFNPIIPVWLYKKQIWTVIDILTAAAFILYRLDNLKKEELSK